MNTPDFPANQPPLSNQPFNSGESVPKFTSGLTSTPSEQNNTENPKESPKIGDIIEFWLDRNIAHHGSGRIIDIGEQENDGKKIARYLVYLFNDLKEHKIGSEIFVFGDELGFDEVKQFGNFSGSYVLTGSYIGKSPVSG